MKKLSIVLFALVSAALFNGCSKPGPTGPAGSTGPAGPSLSGSISGHVVLYDQYGAELAESKAGARVILYNSSNAVIDSVNSDATGLYTINNINTGTYTLVFRDTNFGQEIHQNFQFIGGGTLNVDGRMSRIPNFNITSIAADSINHATQNVVISCNIAADLHQRTLLVFVGNSASVSSNTANYMVVAVAGVGPNKTNVVINIPLDNLYGAGFASASTAYFAVYGAAVGYNSTSSYEDYTTTRTIYNAITPTSYAPFSLVLP